MNYCHVIRGQTVFGREFSGCAVPVSQQAFVGRKPHRAVAGLVNVKKIIFADVYLKPLGEISKFVVFKVFDSAKAADP